MKDKISVHCDEDLDKQDEIAILRLELMDQLIECKKEMENSLREGYFLLGKARYIMGVSAVSALQIPSKECDVERLYYTSKSEEPLDGLPHLKNHQFVIHLNRPNSVIKDSDSEPGSNLRKRGGTETEDVQLEEEEKSAAADVPKVVEPLNWFSALPPQSLRKAQQYFKEAILKSADCATIQSKLYVLSQE